MLRGILYLIGALLYVIFPRDLIPDFLVGWGWIDDAIILYVLWRYLRRMFSQRPPDAGDEASGPTDEERRSRTTTAGDGGRRDPYAILEIGPGAGREEIKAAYRRLAAQ